MEELIKMNGFKSETVCRECGGKCCKSAPGSAFPSDFKEPLRESIIERINTRLWCFDYWEGDLSDKDLKGVDPYYIRPVVKGYEGQVVHAGWGGECCFLSKVGCLLSFDDRPHNCRMLEGLSGDGCKSHDGSKHGGAVAWLPHQTLLNEIIDSINL
jgi:Fe-S-cluster containining protein